jgi:hypothetical protein
MSSHGKFMKGKVGAFGASSYIHPYVYVYPIGRLHQRVIQTAMDNSKKHISGCLNKSEKTILTTRRLHGQLEEKYFNYSADYIYIDYF